MITRISRSVSRFISYAAKEKDLICLFECHKQRHSMTSRRRTSIQPPGILLYVQVLISPSFGVPTVG